MTHTYKYPRPAVTVDALILKKTTAEVLLVKRAGKPFKDCWALPGGFVEMDELLADACLRELKEETGLVLDQVEQFQVYDGVERDPGSVSFPLFFMVLLKKMLKLKAVMMLRKLLGSSRMSFLSLLLIMPLLFVIF